MVYVNLTLLYILYRICYHLQRISTIGIRGARYCLTKAKHELLTALTSFVPGGTACGGFLRAWT